MTVVDRERWVGERRSILIGLVGIAAVSAIRMAILYEPAAPSGIDGGNWLAFGTFVRPGVVYPPLVPSLFSAAVALVAAPLATAIAGAVAIAAPGLAVMAVLVWARHIQVGVLAGLAVAASGVVGELGAWGGYPQPIASACAIVATVAASRWLLGGGRSSLAVFGLSCAAVVATSHLVAVPMLGAILIAIVGTWVWFSARSPTRAMLTALVAVLPVVVLAGTYAALFATIDLAKSGDGADVERVLGAGWPLYFIALLAVPVVLLLERRHLTPTTRQSRDVVVLIAASSAAVSWTLAYIASSEPRLLYDMAILAILGGAALVPRITAISSAPSWRYLIAGLGFATAVGIAASGMAGFPGQVAFYRVLTPDRVEAIEWIADNMPEESQSVLVADLGGVPIGWWVEGLVGREVTYASDLRWVRFPSERARVIAANDYLYGGGFRSAGSEMAAADIGVRMVYLPSSGRFGIDLEAPLGWRIAFRRGDVMVLERIDGSMHSSAG